MNAPTREAAARLCGVLRASGPFECLYLIVHSPRADGFGIVVRLREEGDAQFIFSYISALCTFTERIA